MYDIKKQTFPKIKRKIDEYPGYDRVVEQAIYNPSNIIFVDLVMEIF